MKKTKTILTAALLYCTSHLYAGQPSSSQTKETDTPKPVSYQIRNRKYGALLRPENANGANGTAIVLYSAQPWKCMTWRLHPAGEGAFALQNHFTSKTFRGEIKAQGGAPALVQVPFSKDASERPAWRFTKLADGSYKITDAKTDAALTAVKESGDSFRIVLQPWKGQEEQKWELIETDPSKLTM